MKYLCIAVAFLVCVCNVSAARKCKTVTWRWPQEFKLLSSKDDLSEFVNYNCETYRGKTWFQNGKYFCYVEKETTPPFEFRGLWEDDHGLHCTAMKESFDLTYHTKALCTSFAVAEQFKMSWHYFKLYGYDKARCIRFNRWKLALDVWGNNYMCGNPIVFEKEHCTDV